mmetsp:Transcript_21506/g.42687  ORF Transcript_21506/g.42687 Transcript_21506/m.42687 type:complete len:437 (-) Transcript_21506:786-2096(-)
MYTSYASNKPSANRLLRQLMEEPAYRGFQNYCAQCMANPMSNGNSLESLLIMPVQRVPRYVLLLKEMIKQSADAPERKGRLEAALSKISEVSMKINEATRAQENRSHIHELQTKLGVNLVGPSRKFLKEGPLKLVQSAKDKPVDIMTYLFNDLLLGVRASRLHGFEVMFREEMSKTAKLKVEVLQPGSVGYYRLHNPNDSLRKKKNAKNYKTWSSSLIKTMTDFVSQEKQCSKQPLGKMFERSAREGYLMTMVEQSNVLNVGTCPVGEDGLPAVKEDWGQRYFVLLDQQILIFNNFGDKATQGVVNLGEGGKLVEQPDMRWQLPFCFSVEVSTVEGPMHLMLSCGPNGKSSRAGWLADIMMVDPEKITREKSPDATTAVATDNTSEEVHHTMKLTWPKAGSKLFKAKYIHLEASSKAELESWTSELTEAVEAAIHR